MEVVGLGAWCDFVNDDEYREQLTAMGVTGQRLQAAVQEFARSASFRVAEFALFADGRRVVLHEERGFSGTTSSGDPWRNLTLAGLEADVRTTVLPDEAEAAEEHPWEWLAELIHAHGVDVSADQLRTIAYRVEFSERLVARLTPTQ